MERWRRVRAVHAVALTIGRSTGHALAKRGEYPVAVLRLENAYRVVTAELHQLLGIQTEESVASSV
ncbi:hypothetical protein AB0C96_40955 [Streptomyces sp. NPDC048506]|uniref:hypothetical protein n=1 Tax=Streptomyces sp. NPDC048506 TaxID=3155028 RepID=UPI003444017C